MNWKIKYNLFNRHILMHKHNDLWIEVYQKEKDYFCCLCHEKYDAPIIATLTGVTARPNNKAYFEIHEYFFGKNLKLNPQPSNNLELWDSYGHNHEEGKWKAVTIENKICCPKCLEEAPIEAHIVDTWKVTNPFKPFHTIIQTNRDKDNPEEFWYITYE